MSKDDLRDRFVRSACPPPLPVVSSRWFWQAPWVLHFGEGANRMLQHLFVPPPPRPMDPNAPAVEVHADLRPPARTGF